HDGGDASGNLVLGNYLGTDVTGTRAIGNLFFGIALTDAVDCSIGGTATGASNLVSGNHFDGIWVDQCSQILIQGNLVGTASSGVGGLGNLGGGVTLHTSTGCTVGRSTPGARYVSSANIHYNRFAIFEGATGNIVQGNFICSDSKGSSALSNGAQG